MKLLANENFPLKSILYLKGRGFDINSIGMNNPSIQDSEVMMIDSQEGRTILTFDRDYGELIVRNNHRPSGGVIYFRLEEYEPEEPGRRVEELLTRSELNFGNTLTVVDKNGIRQRKYSI